MLLFFFVGAPFFFWSLANIHVVKAHAFGSLFSFNNNLSPIESPLAGPLYGLGEKDNILFVSDKNNNYEIYMMNLKTKKTANLTNNPADDMNPQVAPSGKSIVFYSDRNGGLNQIYRMELSSKNVTQLTNNSGNNFDPAYSPDGKHIVFKSTQDDGLGDIFMMNQDGSDPINLTSERIDTEEWDPVFTADGKKIIFVVRKGTNHLEDELFTMNIDGSDIRQITKNNISDWYPSVNLQNGNILYISKEKAALPDDIFRTDQENSKKIQITKLPGNDADPAWDATGDKIIFINDADGDYDIYTVDQDGSNVTKIEDTDADELSPIFLP